MVDLKRREKATTAALDFLISECGGDLCAHCAFYVPIKEGEDFTKCKAWDDSEDGPWLKVCREGVVEHFARELKNG